MGRTVAGASVRRTKGGARVGDALKCEVVGALSLGKAAAVDTVVDGGIDPLVHLIDGTSQRLRVQVQLWVLCNSRKAE